MTAMERLVSTGVPESEAHDVLAIIGRVMPIDRPVVLTDEILAAARAGNIAYLRALLAEEDDAEEDERELLDQLTEADYADTITITIAR